ncbi:MAG: Trm112 family protein, partial [Candidatus Omnitrophota bacterium]
MIDEKLLQILACPACKAPVQLKDGKICCVQCKRKYPLRGDIPVMLLEEA